MENSNSQTKFEKELSKITLISNDEKQAIKKLISEDYTNIVKLEIKNLK